MADSGGPILSPLSLLALAPLACSMAMATPDQVARPGARRRWSAKDLLAHIGAWLAEAGVLLEQIAAGSYRREDIDVDDMNRLSLEAMRDIPFRTVKAQATAARSRMRGALLELREPSPDAAWWIAESRPGALRGASPAAPSVVAELRST